MTKPGRQEGNYLASIPHGLMFHHFHNDEHVKGQGSISAATLADMIDFVGCKYILSASDWYERAVAGKLDKNDLCITFDDNLKCQYDVAYPVLKSYGIKAFWFVYTSPLEGELERIEIYRHFRCSNFASVNDFYQAFLKAVQTSPYLKRVEKALNNFDPSKYLTEFPFYTKEDKIFRYIRDRILGAEPYQEIMEQMLIDYQVDIGQLKGKLWMNEEQLRQLDSEHNIIGLHSHSHPTYLGRLPATEQEKEYRKNASVLKNVLAKDPVTVSHPCNSYNQDTLSILHKLGVKVGFRANMYGNLSSRYEYPREDHANILKEMGRAT
ncbi:polysaccharide deacetylase family protein [Halobacillus halophilus]|uniref:polysaccharide deacetylase family protein n=1 Tax=Halobacillus halophilus TaxID=1570 RepID=UPI001CD4E04A|nr:polysaccharide deacetylase family protein [Halobacillus halophilus]MCA1012696.1 polysaccharide deacetylase family protein [Halobacillus halophilus]